MERRRSTSPQRGLRRLGSRRAPSARLYTPHLGKIFPWPTLVRILKSGEHARPQRLADRGVCFFQKADVKHRGGRDHIRSLAAPPAQRGLLSSFAASCKAISIPAETPAAVIIFPSSTTRPYVGMAPRGFSRSKTAQ